jgi:hypothetical protein
MSALEDFSGTAADRNEPGSEEPPRCLADITTPPIRRIDKRNSAGHEGQCPECRSVLATPTALVDVSVRRVANIRLARALLDTGVTTLRSRGSVCTNQGHEEYRLVHTVEDPLAPGWEDSIALPVDCGPAGLQLVPVEIRDLPDGWVEAAVRGLTARDDGGEQS